MEGDHRLYANLGNALWLADQPNLAREAYEQAIDLKFTTYVYRFNAEERAPLF